MPGFTVTANTRALIKYNEASVPGTGYATAVDDKALGGTARNLTEAGHAGSGVSRNYTHIVNGGGASGKGYARWLPGSGLNAALSRAGDATVTAALLASWTWEAFVCPNQQSQNVWAYIGASGTSSAENCLGQVYFDTTGYINMFWEQGSGGAVSSASAAGAITWGVWQHVAITMDWSGATVTVEFWVDGVSITTVTGKTKATGGGNSDIYIGKDSHGNANYYGAMKSVRISSKKRSNAEIAASAALLSTTLEHATDADTICHWKLNEAPDAHEETEYGYHLRKCAGTITVVDPLVADSGHARHMDAATEYCGHWGYEPFRAMLEGDWTYQAWVQHDSGYTSAMRGYWVYGDPGTDVLATNFTSLDLNTSRELLLLMEHGAGGTNEQAEMTVPLFAAVGDGYNKHLITVSKRGTGGTNHEIKFYLDNTLIETIAITQGYDGGTQAWLRVSSGANTGSNSMLGRVDDQIWNVGVITQGELDDIFEETSEGGAPVIELDSPAEGAIDVTDSIVIDVTDVDDDIYVVQLQVEFVNALITETVAYGPVSSPTIVTPYTSTTRTPITDGYRYTITRTGGWIDTEMKVQVFAGDSLGNATTDEFEFEPDYVVHGPIIALITPAEGAIETDDALTVHITDLDDDLVAVIMYIHLVTADIWEVVFHWNAISAPTYRPGYEGSDRDAIANGWAHVITRTGGWVDGEIELLVTALDADGNTGEETFVWTTNFEGTYSCGVAGERPVVTIISPLPVDDPDAPILATDPLVFTITDPDAEPGVGGGLQRAVPVLVFPDALRSLGKQVIHDGDAFSPMFEGSEREAIEGGYQYTVLWWTGRWPSRPRLLPYAYDLSGLEAL